MAEVHDVLTEHLSSRGHDWVTAKELSAEIGFPWRVVARAMVKLTRCAEVEQQVMEWISSRYRTRRCFRYRKMITSNSAYPAWLMPQCVCVDGTGYRHRIGD